MHAFKQIPFKKNTWSYYNSTKNEIPSDLFQLQFSVSAETLTHKISNKTELEKQHFIVVSAPSSLVERSLISCTFLCARSSHLRCSIKNCVFTNFAKFTGKYLCQNLFFNKVAGLRPLRIPLLQNTPGWLLLGCAQGNTFMCSKRERIWELQIFS